MSGDGSTNVHLRPVATNRQIAAGLNQFSCVGAPLLVRRSIEAVPVDVAGSVNLEIATKKVRALVAHGFSSSFSRARRPEWLGGSVAPDQSEPDQSESAACRSEGHEVAGVSDRRSSSQSEPRGAARGPEGDPPRWTGSRTTDRARRRFPRPKASAMPRSSLNAGSTRGAIVAHTAEVVYQTGICSAQKNFGGAARVADRRPLAPHSLPPSSDTPSQGETAEMASPFDQSHTPSYSCRVPHR